MLEADYLIVGSGAVGMAFVDVLLAETEATMIIVDRYAKPGGHWNVAYPFVTLHQPSQYYGVSSKELSNGRKDQIGLNKGLFELATGAEISAYYDHVMRHTFLPSGRIKHFALCDYQGDGQFQSMVTGEVHQVKIKKKLVDTTFLNTAVPATHTPNFTVASDVNFIPINDLVKVKQPPAGYIIIGGGKTGIDACLWLLDQNIDPDRITWIISRDAWLLDRKNTQPTEEFFENTIGAQANQIEAIVQAESIDNLFERLESSGVLLRIDQTVKPQMFHGATISQLELEQLRRIKNVVRKGRVNEIGVNKIALDKGEINTSTAHIHVDCSASAVEIKPPQPIFNGDVITPQMVRAYQPVFSAAFIAHVEATYDDDKAKNKICQIVPTPNHYTDWISMTAAQMVNQFSWSHDKGLRHWLWENRLDGFSKMIKGLDREDATKMKIMSRIRDNAMPAVMKLQQLTNELNMTKNMNLENPQLQVEKKAFFKSRLENVPAENYNLFDGEILVKIEKFAYTANNITYAVAGEMMRYWQFFPASGERADSWGVIPVWGFARVVKSKHDAVPVGDRLYGYFSPSKYLKITPVSIKPHRLIDGAAHRADLPVVYNLYNRVNNEPHYQVAYDNARMVLSPLHLTSYFIWDALQDNDWYGAKQVLILSASSKTSTGLGYACQQSTDRPNVIGVTSSRNLEFVKRQSIYDDVIPYDSISDLDAKIPTAIVDMSGNAKLLSQLHQMLGDHMTYTINVGLTHWTDAHPQEGIIKDRSEFFFAPTYMQKRMKDWGPEGFEKRTSNFLLDTAQKTKGWLTYKEVQGLEELAAIHPDVCQGKIPANEGLVVVMY